MDLNWFGEDGAAAPAAEAGGSAETAVSAGTSAPVQVGETVGGMKVTSPRVAAAMEKQMQRHPELRKVYGRGGADNQAQPQQAAQQVDAQAAQQDGQADADAELRNRWEAAKKGEFARFYGEDVQNAVKDRFKNQKQETAELEGYRKLEPMLKVLRERAGVESNEDLSAQVLDDDSLYEEAANEAGMTVAAYKEFLQYKQEHDQYVRETEERQQKEAFDNHIRGLVAQAEQMKAKFPNFDLKAELQNEQFMRLTSPEVNVSVEDAYFAIHHNELAPQMMAYGMQRAKNQMAQTIMVNGNRPREGGLKTQNAAANMQINPKNLSRQERNRIYADIHAGKIKLFNK